MTWLPPTEKKNNGSASVNWRGYNGRKHFVFCLYFERHASSPPSPRQIEQLNTRLPILFNNHAVFVGLSENHIVIPQTTEDLMSAVRTCSTKTRTMAALQGRFAFLVQRQSGKLWVFTLYIWPLKSLKQNSEWTDCCWLCWQHEQSEI